MQYKVFAAKQLFADNWLSITFYITTSCCLITQSCLHLDRICHLFQAKIKLLCSFQVWILCNCCWLRNICPWCFLWGSTYACTWVCICFFFQRVISANAQITKYSCKKIYCSYLMGNIDTAEWSKSNQHSILFPRFFICFMILFSEILRGWVHLYLILLQVLLLFYVEKLWHESCYWLHYAAEISTFPKLENYRSISHEDILI